MDGGGGGGGGFGVRGGGWVGVKKGTGWGWWLLGFLALAVLSPKLDSGIVFMMNDDELLYDIHIARL